MTYNVHHYVVRTYIYLYSIIYTVSILIMKISYIDFLVGTKYLLFKSIVDYFNIIPRKNWFLRKSNYFVFLLQV